MFLGAFESYAKDLRKKVIHVKCSSDSSEHTVSAVWDNSITPVGPYLVLVDGDEVSPKLTMSRNYITVSGTTPDDRSFEIKLMYDSEYSTKFKIEDEEFILQCQSLNEVYWFGIRMN